MDWLLRWGRSTLDVTERPPEGRGAHRSHHNVGLPEHMKLRLLSPLRTSRARCGLGASSKSRDYCGPVLSGAGTSRAPSGEITQRLDEGRGGGRHLREELRCEALRRDMAVLLRAASGAHRGRGWRRTLQRCGGSARRQLAGRQRRPDCAHPSGGPGRARPGRICNEVNRVVLDDLRRRRRSSGSDRRGRRTF